MIQIYSSVNEANIPVLQETINKGCWVRMIQPTEDEVSFVCDKLSIEKFELMVLLDEEERPRVEFDEGTSLSSLLIPPM